MMNFDDTTILAQEHDMNRRCPLESWFIQRSSTIKCEVGPLPQMYRCHFKFCFLFYIYFLTFYFIVMFPLFLLSVAYLFVLVQLFVSTLRVLFM